MQHRTDHGTIRLRLLAATPCVARVAWYAGDRLVGQRRLWHRETDLILPEGRWTLEVTDEPGVLATVAGILSEGRVSIATVEQSVADASADPLARVAADPTGVARLVIGTHKALEQDLSETVERLADSDVVDRVVSVLRVEGD